MKFSAISKKEKNMVNMISIILIDIAQGNNLKNNLEIGKL
jgi:hypothetical protein